ncbi:hypothetical protein [Actinoplanes regularis]|uniref:Uncharacterized protein n=1 Tax=Actinoplanes regularis TaxID=52697 RepID=A0A238ZMH7_9ACTN|nr:hypothetical protein [Actinoplanes regularis]GIE87591.1 hypothetical protein Are01nite_40710 [Actinoplanes regularis]SNR84329.1 hypothetical protein SAMN06264365_106137 [Actinoplanes regularis]
MTLTFGIYPGGLGVTDDDLVTQGPPEDSEKIAAALDALHGDNPFLVRGYVHYDDATHRAARLSAASSGPAPAAVAPPGPASASVAPSSSASASLMSTASPPVSAVPAGSAPISAVPTGSAPISAVPTGYASVSALRVLEAPPEPFQYATGRRRLDLVACFRECGSDLTGWHDFLREQLRVHGPRLASLQITEEANHAGPGGDGRSPAVRDALVTGVIEAKREAVRLGLDVRIGCNSTLDFSPEQEFWTDLGERGGDEFRAALDYVGLDFFPDVFHPLPADRLPAIVTGALTGFRTLSLAAAGIPDSVPMRITEHGWGTGPDRSYARQAEVLTLVIGIVAEQAATLNIDTYEHFALRDADSDNPNPLFQLGLLRSDYTPKPAFAVYRDLIASSSRSA